MKPNDHIRRDILAVFSTVLKEAGFSKFKKNIAYRINQDRVDIVELRTARRGYNTSYNTGRNSFEIEAAVFFNFAPHPMMVSFDGINNLPVNSSLDGHFRICSKPKLFLRDGFTSNQWRTKPWSFLKQAVTSDVTDNLNSYILPWFEKFSDLESVKSYLEGAPSCDEINAEGKKKNADSWGALHSKTLLAFLYLHLEEWTQAEIKLKELLNKLHPGHKSDPDKCSKYFYQQIRADIERGLVKIEKRPKKL